ncbi:hypothetical protein [Sphaerotilus mobilis]|uniref:PilJ/NarX-like methyl-accepting chemotaxis transducer n=1 Tax=Sphaerotilus mobilis TaxID=47994 RepID=A0A4Q7LQK0_9BURK|nr:hypothetical protein [Sphaerotilus mobilis]RZS56934.1 hypothetical protein EV685_1490 [Sphaerotilus mobilis]
MNPFIPHRRTLVALLAGSLLAGPLLAATTLSATTLSADARQAMLAFDAHYIPRLFLTGSAPKSETGPAKARAALKRLVDGWPARRAALAAAVPGDARWTQALEAVQGHLMRASTQVASADWAGSHETLEHVREVLFEARRAIGIDYPLDAYTAYHGAMETLANATRLDRSAFQADLATARQLWRVLDEMPVDATAHGLDAERSAQLTKARQDETAALAQLTQALAAQAPDAEVLKAAAALKPPFIRAYLSFGAAMP